MTPESSPTESTPVGAESQPLVSSDISSQDDSIDAVDPADAADVVPPLDAPFEVPDVDLVEQRRTATLDDDAWQHD